MINGIINVKKEMGFTSHDVVAKLRGILHQKKIGHTGTLDPDATGVLPVCLGKATKLCDRIGDWDKTYEAVLLLGKTTDTEDISGNVLQTSPVEASEEEVRDVVFSFIGEYAQIPPMYSAKKVHGKKLYELAREGVVIERKPCPVRIFSIDIKEIRLPYVTFSVTCSKGTYIRSLCRDIGNKIGCGGCMASLVRTKVSSFFIEDAITLSEIEAYRDAGTLAEYIVPLDAVFVDYPALTVMPQAEKKLYNGNPVPWISCKEYAGKQTQGNAGKQIHESAGKHIQKCGGTHIHEYVGKHIQKPSEEPLFRLYDAENHFIGIYKKDAKNGLLYPEKLFFDLP